MTLDIISIESISRKWDSTRELWTWEIHWEARNLVTQTEGNYGLKLTEDPRPSMIDALADIAPLLCRALKLPETYANAIHPWGAMKVWQAKWSLDSKGFEYVGIKADKPIGLEKDIPVQLPPVMRGTLPEELREALGVLKAECVHYILGDRAQASFLDGEGLDDIIRDTVERICPGAEHEDDDTTVTFQAEGHEPVTTTTGQMRRATRRLKEEAELATA